MAKAKEGLAKAIASGDRLEALTAIRDYLAHELEGNRCRTCQMSQLRTGDTAAIVLRLQKVMSEIESIPKNDGTVSDLDRIRSRRSAGTPGAKDSTPPAKRRIAGTGGRRTGGPGGPAS